MKRFPTGILIAVLMFAPVMAEEVQFATAPIERNPSESTVGTLANIMASIQLRHIKLWFVGKAKNWDLLNYEAKKLEDDFVSAALFYRNLPIDNVLRAGPGCLNSISALISGASAVVKPPSRLAAG